MPKPRSRRSELEKGDLRDFVLETIACPTYPQKSIRFTDNLQDDPC